MKLVCAILVLSCLARGEDEEERKEKSLLNTFPFNQPELQHAHHEVHEHEPALELEGGAEPNAPLEGGEEPAPGVQEPLPQQALPSLPRQPLPSLPILSSRQGYGPAPEVQNQQTSVGFNSVANGELKDGKRCVDKVEIVEETQYDEVITCDHSYDRRCHTSYSTSFEAQQEEECDENYIKRCYIAYENYAFNETVQVCRKPLVKDCDVAGEPVCRTVYESECWTKQHEHAVKDDVVDCVTVTDEKCEDETKGYTTETKCHKWPRQECKVSKQDVKKFSPVTGCTKEPTQLCAPAGCGFKEGPEICHDKVKTIVQEKPTEECDIEPHRTCKHVTKLVPRLEPREECVDVPKEVCTRSRQNPTRVKKPVIKKWCYVPSAESGLA